MKEGWEYKKLKELSRKQLSYGSGASTMPFDGKVRYIRITDIDDNGNLKAEAVSPSIYDSKYDLSDGDILFARSGATVGKTFLYKEGAYKSIYAGYLIRFVPDINKIIPNYIYHFTHSQHYKSFIALSQNAVAQPNINAKQYGDLQIPLPPLSQQQSIVAELDKINEIIDLKKSQLKDLDLLAQSIFYDMFGDPIENSKGWEVHSMPDVCSIIDGDRGKNYPKQDEFFENGYCLFLNAKNVTSRGFDFEVCSFISKEKDEILRKGKLQRGDVVLTTRGTIGNLAFYNSIVPYEHMRINSGMVILRMKKEFIDEVFFIRQFGFHLDNVKQRIASGSAQPQLPISTMNKINIVLPPLSLQQSFASKIQAIESQKSAIKQSLAEVETLLASRMDYWFGQ